MPLAIHLSPRVVARIRDPEKPQKLGRVLELIREGTPLPKERPPIRKIGIRTDRRKARKKQEQPKRPDDHLQQRILALLLSEGRATTSEIRMICHMGENAAHRRLKDLLQAGVIEPGQDRPEGLLSALGGVSFRCCGLAGLPLSQGAVLKCRPKLS